MTSAGAPRHVPRGVRPAREQLAGLRRYGAEMRRLLTLDAERRQGPRAPAVRTQGMDYAESRPYTAGDDVRRIDWRVTARTGRAHTKLFEHERGHDLYCLVDQRAPMRFGTRAARHPPPEPRAFARRRGSHQGTGTRASRRATISSLPMASARAW